MLALVKTEEHQGPVKPRKLKQNDRISQSKSLRSSIHQYRRSYLPVHIQLDTHRQDLVSHNTELREKRLGQDSAIDAGSC